MKPADYVDVAERIRGFKAEYPDGSLQSLEGPKLMLVGDKTFIVYCAAAYRTPDDQRPGVGWAWEPVPGPTPFTRDSELMNAETSAWGRAIVALGFDTKKIASSEEVRNRQAVDEPEVVAQEEMERKSKFEAPPAATEKPITPGVIAEINAVLKLLQQAFPEHPADGQEWKDVAKAHCVQMFERDTVTDLTLAQGHQLREWLEGQYNQATQAAALPFG